MRTLPIDSTCPTYNYFYDAFDNQKWHTHILLISPNNSARHRHALQLLLNHPECVPNINSHWKENFNMAYNNWAYFGLTNHAYRDSLTADYATHNYDSAATKFITSKFGHPAVAQKIIKSFNATNLFKTLVFKIPFDVDSITEYYYDSFCYSSRETIAQFFPDLETRGLAAYINLTDFKDCSATELPALDFSVLSDPCGAKHILDALGLDKDEQLLSDWKNFVTKYNQNPNQNNMNMSKDQIKQIVADLMANY